MEKELVRIFCFNIKPADTITALAFLKKIYPMPEKEWIYTNETLPPEIREIPVAEESKKEKSKEFLAFINLFKHHEIAFMVMDEFSFLLLGEAGGEFKEQLQKSGTQIYVQKDGEFHHKLSW